MTENDLERLEGQIGRLLRTGVLVTATVLVVGLLLAFAGRTSTGPAVMNGGLLLLVAIPVTRIATSFVDAVRRGDRLLSTATAVVLSILFATLLYSLLH